MHSEEYERSDDMNHSEGSEQVIEFAMLLWFSNDIQVEALSCKIPNYSNIYFRTKK